ASAPAAQANPPGPINSAAAAAPTPAPTPTPTPNGLTIDATPKIVRNASVSLEVGKGGFGGAFDQLAALATANGGFVADSSSSTSTRAASASGHMVLRVPSAHLDDVLAAIGRPG